MFYCNFNHCKLVVNKNISYPTQIMRFILKHLKFAGEFLCEFLRSTLGISNTIRTVVNINYCSYEL